ncbi:MAG: arylesterase [Nitrosomonas sp.]|nr:arylesterase [Nitrosomonas sp.]
MKKFLIKLCFLLICIPYSVVASSDTITVMVYGDSLSTSYGIPSEAGWVNLLNKRLQARSPVYKIVNVSISGETTLGGRNRIEQAIKEHAPDIILIGLGGNDGLRGSSIKSIYGNLEAIVNACLKSQTKVLLLGMRLPPNYGTKYTQKFQDIYPQLAEHHQLNHVPFLLDGFGEKRTYFLQDGIHPNEEAQEKIVENVWKKLMPILEDQENAIISSVESAIMTAS